MRDHIPGISLYLYDHDAYHEILFRVHEHHKYLEFLLVFSTPLHIDWLIKI